MSNDNSSTQFHRLYLKSLRPEVPPIIFHREVLTVGRSETCDVKIDNPYLSQVHASIFYNSGDFYISDLNSTNGTFVNDERVKVTKLKIGDFVRFGAVKYQLLPLVAESPITNEQSVKENTLETINPLRQSDILDKLAESVSPPDFRSNEASNIISEPKESAALPTKQPKSEPFDLETTFSSFFLQQRPVTPLDIAPTLKYSEFIFEENAEGLALDFVKNQPALEITVFINDFVVSVDYFLSSQGQLAATGKSEGNKSITFPFLAADSSIPFLNYKSGQFGVYDYTEDSDWVVRIFGQNGIIENFKVVDGYITLKKDHIVTLTRGDFNIVIKQTDSPPKTIPVPWLIFDTFLKKVLFVMTPAYLALVVGIALIPRSENEFDEQKMENDRIVYVKEIPPVVVLPPAKTTGAQQSMDPAPAKPSAGEIVRSQKVDVPAAKKSIENTAVSIPPIVKTSSPKPVVPPAKVPTNVAPSKVAASKAVTQKPVIINNEAAESIPPRLDMKALQNKIEKKLETTGVASNIVSGKTSDELEGARSLVGVNTGTKVKDVGPLQSNNTGAFNVAGADTGDLGKGKSVSSSLGGDIGFFDGTGGKKEMLGIMDPNEVQNVLRKYIPQFQFCYEKELERINKKVATTLVLQFTISSEGRPVNANLIQKI
jgi:pSer/pThr/pTyr-binding forkhead associated (FHA) protein